MATSRLIPRSFALFLLLLLSLLPGASRAAQPAGTDLYLFWARGCPRYSHLIGGAVLLAIGALLLLRPGMADVRVKCVILNYSGILLGEYPDVPFLRGIGCIL